jgi:hypothetical protein
MGQSFHDMEAMGPSRQIICCQQSEKNGNVSTRRRHCVQEEVFLTGKVPPLRNNAHAFDAASCGIHRQWGSEALSNGTTWDPNSRRFSPVHSNNSVKLDPPSSNHNTASSEAPLVGGRAVVDVPAPGFVAPMPLHSLLESPAGAIPAPHPQSPYMASTNKGWMPSTEALSVAAEQVLGLQQSASILQPWELSGELTAAMTTRSREEFTRSMHDIASLAQTIEMEGPLLEPGTSSAPRRIYQSPPASGLDSQPPGSFSGVGSGTPLSSSPSARQTGDDMHGSPLALHAKKSALSSIGKSRNSSRSHVASVPGRRQADGRHKYKAQPMAEAAEKMLPALLAARARSALVGLPLSDAVVIPQTEVACPCTDGATQDARDEGASVYGAAERCGASVGSVRASWGCGQGRLRQVPLGEGHSGAQEDSAMAIPPPLLPTSLHSVASSTASVPTSERLIEPLSERVARARKRRAQRALPPAGSSAKSSSKDADVKSEITSTRPAHPLPPRDSQHLQRASRGSSEQGSTHSQQPALTADFKDVVYPRAKRRSQSARASTKHSGTTLERIDCHVGAPATARTPAHDSNRMKGSAASSIHRSAPNSRALRNIANQREAREHHAGLGDSPPDMLLDRGAENVRGAAGQQHPCTLYSNADIGSPLQLRSHGSIGGLPSVFAPPNLLTHSNGLDTSPHACESVGSPSAATPSTYPATPHQGPEPFSPFEEAQVDSSFCDVSEQLRPFASGPPTAKALPCITSMSSGPSGPLPKRTDFPCHGSTGCLASESVYSTVSGPLPVRCDSFRPQQPLRGTRRLNSRKHRARFSEDAQTARFSFMAPTKSWAPGRQRGKHGLDTLQSSSSMMSTRDSAGWRASLFGPLKPDPRDVQWGEDDNWQPDYSVETESPSWLFTPQVPSAVLEDPEEGNSTSVLLAEPKPLRTIEDTQQTLSTRERLKHKHGADGGTDRVLFRRRRPDFVKLFAEAAAEAERLGESRVAVLICSNHNVMDLCMKQVAAQNREGNVKFDVHCEAFSF